MNLMYLENTKNKDIYYKIKKYENIKKLYRFSC
jgi:hypothetical protein